MKLAVIVPIRNEPENVPVVYGRARPVLDALPGVSAWEILFVNDGSTDGSLDAILALRAADPRVKVVTLSRPFGYNAALTAGLTTAEADLYAMVDVDCEDPPELFRSFAEAIAENRADVAYGIRSKRDEPGRITWFRGLFYRINNRIADSPTVMWMAEFSMITRQVRDAILTPRTTFPFLRAEIAYAGFRLVGFPYFRARRQHGATHYRFLAMVRFAVAGFLSSSTFPLRAVLYAAFAVGAGVSLYFAAVRPGLGAAANVAAIGQFYFVLASVPMLALYLARAYKNGVARSVFIVDKNRTHL